MARSPLDPRLLATVVASGVLGLGGGTVGGAVRQATTDANQSTVLTRVEADVARIDLELDVARGRMDSIASHGTEENRLSDERSMSGRMQVLGVTRREMDLLWARIDAVAASRCK